jgi:hypothetical protein
MPRYIITKKHGRWLVFGFQWELLLIYAIAFSIILITWWLF